MPCQFRIRFDCLHQAHATFLAGWTAVYVFIFLWLRYGPVHRFDIVALWLFAMGDEFSAKSKLLLAIAVGKESIVTNAHES